MTKSPLHNTDIPSDARLSEILKRHLPDAPPQPWFTRTVLNRLPDRTLRIVSLIEYALYIIGIVATSIATINLFNEINAKESICGTQILTALLFVGIFGALLYSILSPWVSASTLRQQKR